MEQDVDANYQRYNGLHYGRKFRSGASKDLAESYNVWNARLNLLQLEDARWMEQENAAFNVGDGVEATTNIIYANVEPGVRDIIKAIIPLLKGNIDKPDMFTYQYDVLFENGYTAVNVDQWQVRKAAKSQQSFAKYSKGDAWENDRMRMRILDLDVKNGETVYLVEQSYTNRYSYPDPDFHNVTEAALEKILVERQFSVYSAPQLIDDFSDEIDASEETETRPANSSQQHLRSTNPNRNPTHSQAEPSDFGFYSIADATNVKPRSLRLERTKPLFKKLCQRFNMLIWGQPGQGKSSFLLLLASDLAKTGKVLLILREERIVSGRVGERAKRMNIMQSSDIILNDSMSIAELRELLKKNPSLQFVGVDSLQRWDRVTEEDVEELIQDFPNVSFVFVAQSNKAGKEYRGFSQLANTVDTVVNVSSGTASATKHRDGDAAAEFKIFKRDYAGAKVQNGRTIASRTIFKGLKL